MSKDTILLENLDPTQDPILHFYRWQNPSVTYGHFIKPEEVLNLSGLRKLGIDAAKRPTGGGVIFHLFDLAFSFLLPSRNSNFFLNPLQNYAFVNGIIQTALSPFIEERAASLLPVDPIDPSKGKHFCMAKPTIYDVVIEGKKVAGAAQRKKHQGYLHQGSIAIVFPKEQILREVLKDPDLIIPKMKENSFFFLGEDAQNLALEAYRAKIESALEEAFMAAIRR